jgi:hypothetical protein
MRVIIQPDYATLSRWAAAYVVHSIRQFNPTRDRPRSPKISPVRRASFGPTG